MIALEEKAERLQLQEGLEDEEDGEYKHKQIVKLARLVRLVHARAADRRRGGAYARMPVWREDTHMALDVLWEKMEGATKHRRSELQAELGADFDLDGFITSRRWWRDFPDDDDAPSDDEDMGDTDVDCVDFADWAAAACASLLNGAARCSAT